MNENENVSLIVNESFSKDELVTKVNSLIDKKDNKGLNELLNDVSAITFTEVLDEFDKEEIASLYLLSNDYSKLGELFSYLPISIRVYLCKNLSKKALSNVLYYVKDDDLADFLEDITKPLREKLLTYIPSKRRKGLITLSKYSDDTIGSIMTTEYLYVRQDTLISDVFKKIKNIGKHLETVRTIFIIDNTNHLIGIKSLEEMMFDDEDKKIGDVMSTDFPYISPLADKEKASDVFKEFDITVLPVLSKNNEMLGIITFDDVLDIIEEENTEDIYKQSAIAPTNKSYKESNVFKIALSYVIWLVILLIINTFASIIVDTFESELLTIPVLISFLPVLNDTGGNSGDQTTSTITRALATNEITTKDYFKVLKKEAVAGFLTALVASLISFGWTMVELNTPILNVGNTLDKFISDVGGNKQVAFMIVSLVISVSLFFAIFVSKLLGATLPILAKLCHIDPALISGPLITSIMDILTLLIYFSLAKFIINYFDPGEITSLVSFLFRGLIL